MSIHVRRDDLSSAEVQSLVAEHLAGMNGNSPPGHVHALALESLRAPDVTFWSAWAAGTLCGCGALKELDRLTGEVKSMRTRPAFLRKGVAQAVLDEIVRAGRERGYSRLVLETGTGPAFEPAHALYRRNGFEWSGPFGEYTATDFNVFMAKDLARPVEVRPVREADIPAMLEIYRPYVQGTAISFEEAPPPLEEFSARIRKYAAGWACFVAESEGRVVGYAYGSTHRERAAYRWSVETTVYVAADAHRRGIGRALYGALLPALADAGFCNAYAGVALPNEGSVGLHRAAGFQPIGTFPRVGHKLGQWRDVAWFHLPLRAEPPAPGPG